MRFGRLSSGCVLRAKHDGEADKSQRYSGDHHYLRPDAAFHFHDL